MELEQNPIVSIIEHRGKPCKDFLLLHPYCFEMSRNIWAVLSARSVENM
jgi:hypothetical protein